MYFLGIIFLLLSIEINIIVFSIMFSIFQDTKKGEDLIENLFSFLMIGLISIVLIFTEISVILDCGFNFITNDCLSK